MWFLRSRMLRRKAEAAAAAAAYVATGTTLEFVQRYPEFSAVSNDDWDAFVIAGCHWSLLTALTASTYRQSEQAEVAQALSASLAQYVPDIDARTSLLIQHVKRLVDDKPDILTTDGLDTLAMLVGSWCLAQAGHRRPSEISPVAARHLGLIIILTFRDWWKET
ncbi:MAG TPA: hypothetical protein VNL96_06750 [Gemmatimonadaceae bacterium]|nr:hypothetical protein [Gemmatimonadaceae bacterium]